MEFQTTLPYRHDVIGIVCDFKTSKFPLNSHNKTVCWMQTRQSFNWLEAHPHGGTHSLTRRGRSKSILQFLFNYPAISTRHRPQPEIIQSSPVFFLCLRTVKNVLFIQIFIVSPFFILSTSTRKWKHLKSSFYSLFDSFVNNSTIRRFAKCT